MTTVELVDATTADTETLIDMMRALAIYDLDVLDEARARAALAAFFASDGRWGRLWLVQVDGATAGYLALTYGFSFEYGGRDAIVDELYLREPYRGQGVGSAVMAFLQDFCRAEGIGALHLEVFDHNTAAARFYEAHGFGTRASRFLSLKL